MNNAGRIEFAKRVAKEMLERQSNEGWLIIQSVYKTRSRIPWPECKKFLEDVANDGEPTFNVPDSY